ncbi:MAG TPA: PDZ domain-containing protein [Syntrophomonadaceae bacterium]|nr:PDZ domain-containing protein [Syntrophomonadaceae bacterium]
MELPVLMQMGRVFLAMFCSPFFLFLYFLLFVLVASQYKRIQQVTDRIIGINPNQHLRSALQSAVFGLLGGVLGSILLVFLGVDLSNIGIGALWIVALVLMFIHPRFLCFAYAAGLVSLSNLFFGFPDISIPQLIGLVAILHMVESFLIGINGARHPLPIYVRKQGYIQGGFNLQYFWPIPLLALVAAGFFDLQAAVMKMPDWWPLLNDYAPFSTQNNYILVPVMAILGYGEISTTRTPQEAARRSACHLFFFSMILLILAVLAARWSFFAPLAALFSPLGHEFIIWLGMREEVNRKPMYIPGPQGLKVMHVWPGTPAQRRGIRPGDIILTVNGNMIQSLEQMHEQLQAGINWLEIDRQGEYIRLKFDHERAEGSGIVPVPSPDVSRYLDVNEDSIFTAARQLWHRWKRP